MVALVGCNISAAERANLAKELVKTAPDEHGVVCYLYGGKISCVKVQ